MGLDSAEILALVGSGVSVLETLDSLPTSNLIPGDEAFIKSNNKLYVSNGVGWYNTTTINRTPRWVTEPSNTTYAIADSATPLSITALAADSDNAILLNQSFATDSAQYMVDITTDSSVFTFTPKSKDSIGIEVAAGNLTDSNGDFVYTFKWSDGVNFVSKVVDISYSPASGGALPLGAYGTRALGAGYYDIAGADDVNTIYYFETTTGTSTSTFGNLTSADRAQGIGISNKTLGIFLGGRVWHTGQTNSNKMDYITFATTGNGTSFGSLGNETSSHSVAGTGDGTYGVWLRGGYSSKPSPMPIDYTTIATSGSASQWGTFTSNSAAGVTGNDTRGLFSVSSTMQYITYTSQGNAAAFNPSGPNGGAGFGVTDATYAMFGNQGDGANVYYVTIDTTGNATALGHTITYGADNDQEYWSNDTGYGLYSRYYYGTDGIQKINVSTLSNASTFFDQSPATGWGASASGNNA